MVSGKGGLWTGGKAVAILSDLAKRVSSNAWGHIVDSARPYGEAIALRVASSMEK